MPHVWNNILVVTKDELIPFWWSSYNSLKVQIHRYKDKSYGIKKVCTGGNGRQVLIQFDTLPAEIQTALGDPTKCDHILQKFYSVDPGAVQFYSNYKFEAGGYLDMDMQEQYIINASVLKSLIELKAAREVERKNKGASVKGIMETLIFDAHSFNPILQATEKVQHNLPTSRRFKETFNAFLNEGYETLISKKFKNNNAKKITDYTEKILNDLFGTQSHKPTATEVSRQYDSFLSGYLEVINGETGEVYSSKGLKNLSSSSIKKFLTTWKSKTGTHAKRSGDRQVFKQKFEPYHSLIQPEFAGSIISIDDRNPPFEYEPSKRVWFYNAVDLGSGAITCWVYGKTKEGIIVDFYRQLLRNYHEWGLNLPYEIECESALNSSYKNTFLKNGAMFQSARIEANNARGKRCERVWGELRYGLEKKREGWLARPFAKSESNQIGAKKKVRLPYETIVNNGLEDIQTYNNMSHNKETSKSKWEYFLENQNPDLPETNYKAILPHLGFKTPTSCHAGIIRLQSGEWFLGQEGEVSTGEDLVRLMSIVEGHDIDIFWIDDNEGKVFKALIYIDNEFICEAVEKPKYHRATAERTPQCAINQDILTRYVSTIQHFIKNQKNELEEVIIIDNTPLTVNSKFKMPGLKQYESTETDEVEVLPNYDEEEDDVYEYAPVRSTSWKDKFN